MYVSRLERDKPSKIYLAKYEQKDHSLTQKRLYSAVTKMLFFFFFSCLRITNFVILYAQQNHPNTTTTTTTISIVYHFAQNLFPILKFEIRQEENRMWKKNEVTKYEISISSSSFGLCFQCSVWNYVRFVWLSERSGK